MKKITTDSLVQYIDRELSQSTNYNDKISSERTKALKYYNKQPYGNEKKGRSTYVSSEVFETISWALPQIMKIFSTSDTIKFDASKPEYKESAEMATAYANYVINKENPGFLILHDFFQDALLQKNGFLKIYYDKSDSFEREEYSDLTDLELTLLVQDKNVEVLTHDETTIVDPVSQQHIATKHDITIKRKLKSTGGSIKIENVPVEEVIVSKLSRSLNLDDAPFVCHRVKKSISWLRQQGYKIPDDINDGSDAPTDYTTEKLTRDYQDGNYSSSNTDEIIADPSTRLVLVTEAYFKVDFDGDGIAEQRKVTKVGSTILVNEEVHIQPFVTTSPFPQSHKFNGISMADLVTDLQLLKSMLMRAMLDSYAFNINPSKAVDISKVVDVNDLLDTNPGNFIRMRSSPAESIMSLPSSGIGDSTFNLLKYVDDIAESRSGVSKMTQGIDKNVFNKTATGTQAIMSASQEKLALIVRIFAETGLANLYKKIIQLASKYSDGPELIEMHSQFVEVNPMDWKHLKNISVNVGTGSLDSAQEMNNLNNILSIQEKVMSSQNPSLVSMIDPLKIFNSISDLTKSMGYSNPSVYFNKPGGQEYIQMVQYMQSQVQPAPIDPNLALVETQKQANEQNMLIKTAEFELDKLKADREFELKKYEIQLKYELELAKLSNIDSGAIMTSQISQVGNLNPSSELLSTSEINNLTKVLDSNQMNNGQTSLYAQLISRREQENAFLEQERQKQKEQSDNMLSMIHELNSRINKPKKVLRDEMGRVVGLAIADGE